jgi:hypothetical protein
MQKVFMMKIIMIYKMIFEIRNEKMEKLKFEEKNDEDWIRNYFNNTKSGC